MLSHSGKIPQLISGLLLKGAISIVHPISIVEKIKDYAVFVKLRLALFVVFSAVTGYFMGVETADYTRLFWIVLGGFLVTASSNGFNQLIEKDFDKLMTRTASRPLPKERMGVNEALIAGGITGVAGVIILWKMVNPMCGILGMTALLLYTLLYTPLKRITPFAVFVGAFPGAIPPLIGWVASTDGFGHFSLTAWILFAIQFMWQFPHFWAIAWRLDDDYKKAGFKMLPSEGGRDKASAFQIIVYTLGLIPVSLTPYIFNITGGISAFIIFIAGAIFAWQAYQLYRTLAMKEATKLMFGSFLYLAVVQIALLLDKV